PTRSGVRANCPAFHVPAAAPEAEMDSDSPARAALHRAGPSPTSGQKACPTLLAHQKSEQAPRCPRTETLKKLPESEDVARHPSCVTVRPPYPELRIPTTSSSN